VRARLDAWLTVRLAFLAVMLVFVLLPIYWSAVSSIKPADDFFRSPPPWFPSHPTLDHYRLLGAVRGWEGIENSLIVAVATTILSVFLGTTAGYSMARFRTGGKQLALWVLSQRMMPPIAALMPLFLLYRQLRLLDSRIGLVLLYTVFTLPFSVWMMFTYFRQLPVELEEAALVDGCSRWGALWRIAWPLAAPGLVSAAVFSFIFAWTEFIFAVVLTTRRATTLPVVISSFIGVQSSLIGEVGALAVLSFVPAILLGFLVQKHLARGLTLGAVQG
jgi:multiple sugar transport system permease protein